VHATFVLNNISVMRQSALSTARNCESDGSVKDPDEPIPKWHKICDVVRFSFSVRVFVQGLLSSSLSLLRHVTQVQVDHAE